MDWPAVRAEAHRSHPWEVAHRMMGSSDGAEDVGQASWLRLDRSSRGPAFPDRGGVINEIELITETDRPRRLGLAVLDGCAAGSPPPSDPGGTESTRIQAGATRPIPTGASARVIPAHGGDDRHGAADRRAPPEDRWMVRRWPDGGQGSPSLSTRGGRLTIEPLPGQRRVGKRAPPAALFGLAGGARWGMKGELVSRRHHGGLWAGEWSSPPSHRGTRPTDGAGGTDYRYQPKG
ncbi:MAG: hypothetical protein AVDCRST_MAG70-411 [uncultured Thermomicrobiales bacterium]|uniref:Uncharacterized protein n=1 Tax=uncultured Thermomicrobiales bacterium TaxID=1645740 RepID=A0A6J4UBA0_9BACT|nr:MAG: hypothetical protein AVDCRST_MAG70-411 [uncultured Thermomicrobiales bacterium]